MLSTTEIALLLSGVLHRPVRPHHMRAIAARYANTAARLRAAGLHSLAAEVDVIARELPEALAVMMGSGE